jgi:hypothetical protein
MTIKGKENPVKKNIIKKQKKTTNTIQALMFLLAQILPVRPVQVSSNFSKSLYFVEN